MSILERFKKKVSFTAPAYLLVLLLATLTVTGFLLFSKSTLPTLRRNPAYPNEFYYKEFMKVVDECTGSTQIEVDTCVLSHAVSSNDLNLCRIITEESLRKRCIATIRKDKNICKTIPLKTERQLCISKVELLLEEFEKGRKACPFPRGSKRDSCLYEKAINVKDLALCNEITNESIRLECIAVLKVDKKLCYKLPEKDSSWWDVNLRKRCISIIDNILKGPRGKNHK